MFNNCFHCSNSYFDKSTQLRVGCGLEPCCRVPSLPGPGTGKIIGRPNADDGGAHDDGNGDDFDVDDDTSPAQPAADDVRLQASRVKLPA